LGRHFGKDLNAGDLKHLVLSMEKALAEGKDSDGKIAAALTTLKGLVATAVLDNPDEVRRVLSLATFLFVSAATGGVAGLVMGGSAKVITDYFLTNFLPQADPQKPESKFSKMLRLVEIGVAFASGGIPMAGTYAVTELAHQLVPEQAKPALVFGAAAFGLGLPFVAAAGVTAAAEFPHTTIDLAGKVTTLVKALFNPKQIPALILKEIKGTAMAIVDAVKGKRWSEAALRIAVIALPIIVVVAAIVGFALSGGILLKAALVVGIIGSVLVILAFAKLSEKQKKEAMIRSVKQWRADFERQYPNPEQRDAGVVKVFDAIEEMAKRDERLTRETFLSLLKKHIPAFADYSIEQLDTALTTVQKKHAESQVASPTP
jgi:hypothetical protein